MKLPLEFPDTDWRPVVEAPAWNDPESGTMRSRSSRSGSGDSGWAMR